MSEDRFSVSLRLLENYLFEIDFGEFGNFMTDEPEPLGGGEGPNPSRLLAASVANCLCASLLFAIRKFNQEPGEINATITGTLGRENKRLRMTQLDVAIQLGDSAANIGHLDRALAQFEDFCVVTQSVRNGIPINVTVKDSGGNIVKGET